MQGVGQRASSQLWGRTSVSVPEPVPHRTRNGSRVRCWSETIQASWMQGERTERLTNRSGWITFAGVAALIAGGYNALSGIGALADDDTIAAQATQVLYGIDLTAWGWFWLIVGIVQLITGVLILQRSGWDSVSASASPP